MTRKKKTRKINTFSPQLEPRNKKVSPSKKKKGKGLPSGNKNNPQSAATIQSKPQTPEKAAKKQPVPLIRPHRLHQSSTMAPYDELIALENDPRLHQLLDKKEHNQPLSAEECEWLQNQLNRIEVLLNTCDGDNADHDE